MNKEQYNDHIKKYEELYELASWASIKYAEARAAHGLSCEPSNDGEYLEFLDIIEFDKALICTQWTDYDGNRGRFLIPVDAIIGTERERLLSIQNVVKREIDEKHGKVDLNC